MSHTNLKVAAAQLTDAWTSTVVARVGGVNLKVLRMDGTPYADESHEYPEGLLVIDGLLNLTIDGTTIKVNSGELFVVPSGVVHGVGPGSAGTLVVFDV